MNSPERKHRRLNETLLFPSLGSTDFQIPAAIAAGALRTSLSKLDAAYPLGLTFCDDSADASVSILHQPEFASNVDSVLNVHEVSTLGDLGLVLAPRPSILVVECNWRFAPNANRLSAALHRLLGNGSDAPTALLAGTLAGSAQLGAQVGLAYPVAVPSTCILATEYGLRHIIYSRPPNLNPTRPDCISDSGSISAHALAKAELERLYDNIFACGASLSLDVLPASDHASSANLPPSPTHDASSASTTTGAAGSFISGISSTTAAASDNADVATNRFETSSASFGAYVHPGKANVSQSSPGSWRFPLHNMLARPQDFKPQIYYEDDEVLVAYDGFPKARVHLLLMPKPNFLQAVTPSHLTSSHVPALQRVLATAQRIAAHLSPVAKPAPISLGFHAIPSLEPLHLHIISQDFVSPCLKHKKHWNSFMAPFFVDPALLVAQLDQGRTDGGAQASRSKDGHRHEPLGLVPVLGGPTELWHAMIEAPLRCVPGSCLCGCGTLFSTMPALKAHLAAALEKK